MYIPDKCVLSPDATRSEYEASTRSDWIEHFEQSHRRYFAQYLFLFFCSSIPAVPLALELARSSWVMQDLGAFAVTSAAASAQKYEINHVLTREGSAGRTGASIHWFSVCSSPHGPGTFHQAHFEWLPVSSSQQNTTGLSV